MNSLVKLSVTATLAILALAFTTSKAWAYNEVWDTGEVLERGHYRLTGGGQLLTERGGGNVTGMFDTGIQEDFSVRGLVGFGKTDYYVGGLVKWVPIPDAEGQPAVGVKSGLTYARWNDTGETTLRIEPLVSKKFAVGEGVVTPYVSTPLGLRFGNSSDKGNNAKTLVTFQLVGGAQLQVERWKNLQFLAEVGLNLEHNFTYISTAAVFYFDNENGFKLE